MVSSWIIVLCLAFLSLAESIRHEKNLIWAQTPAMKLTVSRLVGIEGDPSIWVSNKKPNVKHISAPHYRWEFKALGYSYRKQLLVWSESMNKRIQSLMLNGSTETTDVFPGTSSQVMGLAVDWLSSNVYWGDALYNWIMMCPLTQPAGKHVYKILVQDGLDNPHGMAICPSEGLLFFSDWGIRPRIERCDLQCENRVILAEDQMKHPQGLAVDVQEKRLYWVDSDLDTVESILFDGTQRKIIKSDPDTSFYGVALYENFIFVTEQQHGVLKVFQQDKEAVSFTLGNVPYGIVMYDESQQPGDSGPCDNAGCEHMCVWDPKSGTACLCGNGYDLMADQTHCEFSKQFVHPSHLYAIGVAICQYPANIPDMSLENVTLTSQCFLTDRYGYLALTFDARENMLYYSGNYTNTISAIPLEVGAKAKVIAGGTGVVKGLALDWVTGNIYWTDSTNAYIKVARKDGAFQQVLISEDVNNPLGIAVHPSRGKMFWTDIGFTPDVPAKVEMANMDGTERQQIMAGFDEVGQPNHMYLDVQNDLLYWADSERGMIRRYSIPTGKIDVYYQMKDVKFYGISLFRDFILWTDTDDMNGIHMARVDLGRKVRGIIHPKYGIAADVITFDINHQPNVTSPCAVSEHNCDQLCLTVGNNGSYTCACGLGFTLADDGRACTRTVVQDNFLLVNDAYQKQVYQVNLKNGVVNAIGLQTQHEPIALDYNPMTSHVYWSDNNAHVLARTQLQSGDTQIVRGLSSISVCDGIAVDYTNHLLFYTDTGLNVIGVTSLIYFDYHVTLIKETLDEPRDIVVSPTDGYIFWSDWGKEPRIARAVMDGTEVKTLVNFTMSAWPNGLALDVKGRTLYYADAQNNAIGTYHIDTGEQRIMVKEPAAHYFGLFVMGDFLYLTDWRRNFVARMHKLGGVVMQFGPSNFTKLYGVSGFNSSELLRSKSVCLNHSCDHICVPRPLNVPQCLCSDGFSLIKGKCIDTRPSTTTNTTTTTTTTTTTATVSSVSSSMPTTSSPPSSSQQPTAPTSQQNTIPTNSDQNRSTTTWSKPAQEETTTTAIDTNMGSKVTHPATTTIDNNTGSKVTHPATTTIDNNTGDKIPNIRPNATILTTGQSRAESNGKYTIIVAISVSAAVVLIALIIAAAIYYRRRREYTVPHAKLTEDNSTTFPKIFYAARNQDTITFDSGIENPTYDVTQVMLGNGTSE